MEEIRTKGIVIDTKDYKEYDKIITILTFDRGVIKAQIKGVKRSTAKSRFAGQIFCFIDLILTKRGEYYTVISCDLLESFFEIAYNYEKFLLATDIVKVVKYVSKYHPDSSELFVTFLSILNVLLKTNTHNNITYLKFLLSTLKILGFEHNFKVCDKCKERLQETSFIDMKVGGIVCGECVKNNVMKVSEKEREVIIRVSNSGYSDLEDINVDEETLANVLKIVQTLFKINCNQ